MIVALMIGTILLLAAAAYFAIPRRKPKRRPATRYFSHTFAASDPIALPSETDQAA